MNLYNVPEKMFSVAVRIYFVVVRMYSGFVTIFSEAEAIFAASVTSFSITEKTVGEAPAGSLVVSRQWAAKTKLPTADCPLPTVF